MVAFQGNGQPRPVVGFINKTTVVGQPTTVVFLPHFEDGQLPGNPLPGAY